MQKNRGIKIKSICLAEEEEEEREREREWEREREIMLRRQCMMQKEF